MNTKKIALNINFQVIAMTEALRAISANTGATFEALMAQLPTNAKLQARVAEMVILSAKVMSKELAC